MNEKNEYNPINTENPRRKELPPRLSFFLCLWCADEAGRSNWRSSLEMPGAGKRIGFASLEQLFVYLLDLCESQNDVEDKKSKPDIGSERKEKA